MEFIYGFAAGGVVFLLVGIALGSLTGQLNAQQKFWRQLVGEKADNLRTGEFVCFELYLGLHSYNDDDDDDDDDSPDEVPVQPDAGSGLRHVFNN